MFPQSPYELFTPHGQLRIGETMRMGRDVDRFNRLGMRGRFYQGPDGILLDRSAPSDVTLVTAVVLNEYDDYLKCGPYTYSADIPPVYSENLGRLIVTAASWSAGGGGTGTFTTSVAHNLKVGGKITVEGMHPSGYDGTYTVVTTPTTTTLTVAMVSNPGTYTGCGTIVDESTTFLVAKPYDLQRSPWDGQLAPNEDASYTLYNYAQNQLAQRVATTGTPQFDGNCNPLTDGANFLFSDQTTAVTENIYPPYRPGDIIACVGGSTGTPGLFTFIGSAQAKGGASVSTLVLPTAFVGSGNGYTLNAAAVLSGGLFYVVGDLLTVVGGVYRRPAVLQVLTAPGGVVGIVGIVDAGDYLTVPNNAVNVTGGSGSGATFNLTWNDPTGDLVVVLFADLIGAGAPVISDSLGNTWTAFDATPKTNTVRVFGWYTIVTNSGDCTVTIGFGTSATAARAALIFVCSGNAVTTKDADVTWANTTGGALNCPSTGTLAQADEVVFGFAALADPGPIGETAPNIMVTSTATSGGSASTNVTVGACWQIRHATTAVSPAMVGPTAAGVLGTASFKIKSLGIQFIDVNEAGRDWQRDVDESFFARLVSKTTSYTGFIRYAWERIQDTVDPNPLNFDSYGTPPQAGTFERAPAYHLQNVDLPVGVTSRPVRLTKSKTNVLNLPQAYSLINVSIAAAGSGYTLPLAPTTLDLTVSGGTFDQAVVVSVVDVDPFTGAVLEVVIKDPGRYSKPFPTNPVATTSSAGGTGCTLNLTFGLDKTGYYLIEVPARWEYVIITNPTPITIGNYDYFFASVMVFNHKTLVFEYGESVLVADVNDRLPV